jgi:phosphonopyruvate decarboxylase
MIEAQEFIGPALELGYSFWAGVPCSFLTPFINYVIQSPELVYTGAASEGEAVAVAAGAHLAGRKSVVICQNSGLGNTVNPLTSLNYPFRIPSLLITTHRGAPGIHDEPQHELMGRITGSLLELMEIPWEPFPCNPGGIREALQRLEKSVRERHRPYAFVMAKGTVAKYPLRARATRSYLKNGEPKGFFERTAERRLARSEAIRVIRDSADAEEDAIIATTGKIGRELFAFGHRPNHLYMVGSMGCASALGLGICLAGSRKQMVVLDGDGALLMKMGTLGTIGHYQPERFVHIVLDNEAHESTGAQATSSPTMDFCSIAMGSGYRNAWRVDGAQELAAAFRDAKQRRGPNMIHVKVGIATQEDLGRPSLTPEAVKLQFMEWLAR